MQELNSVDFYKSILQKLDPSVRLDSLSALDIIEEFKAAVEVVVDDFVERMEEKIDSAIRGDSAPAVKRVVNWQGLSLGITHEPGDHRFGENLVSIPLQPGVSYGHLRRSYGAAEDKKAFDVYYSAKNSDRLFKIRQLDPETGAVDESKYALGFDSIQEARDVYRLHAGRDRFGGIEAVSTDELAQYKAQKYHQDSCGCEECQIVHKKKSKRKSRRRRINGVLAPARTDATTKDDIDLADLITEQATTDVAPAVDEWLGQIEKWLEKTGSLELCRDRIPELYDQLNSEDFTQGLEQKRIIADLGGRLEVLKETENDANVEG